MGMGKLLDEEKFWDLYWDFERTDNDAKVLGRQRKRNNQALIEHIFSKNLFSKRMREYMGVSYHDYFLWEVIYKKYMPNIKGAKVLEIGSAPGNHLVKLNQAFGFMPYGVEHSERGVKLNRELFRLHNLDPDNVIYADFFCEEFQNKYKGYFDIVISRGFIEDFTGTCVEAIIEKHINLLSKGGYLFVSIPNIRGIYYLWALFFDKKLLSELNLDIMKKEKFLQLFANKNMLALFCGYYGTFSCGNRFSTRRDSPMYFVLSFLDSLQLILNLIFRLILRNKGAESRLFSPYLQFVGIRKA